ncbi:(2Fe-2S)-binding protein [Terrabacter terrigena]|uniref:Bacterioferritin-associated ferredoxin n=1 Tax=Terrabacter terrigena TaxID=574718 RepID=A0ABW3MV01_9MICO
MIICQCAVVSDDDVVRAVDAGASNLAYVCQMTGAGQDCGSCVFSVRRVICQHEGTQRDTFLEVEGAAS